MTEPTGWIGFRKNHFESKLSERDFNVFDQRSRPLVRAWNNGSASSDGERVPYLFPIFARAWAISIKVSKNSRTFLELGKVEPMIHCSIAKRRLGNVILNGILASTLAQDAATYGFGSPI